APAERTQSKRTKPGQTCSGKAIFAWRDYRDPTTGLLLRVPRYTLVYTNVIHVAPSLVAIRRHPDCCGPGYEERVLQDIRWHRDSLPGRGQRPVYRFHSGMDDAGVDLGEANRRILEELPRHRRRPTLAGRERQAGLRPPSGNACP